MSIKLNDEFFFIRTPRESRSDRALLLENFNLGISPGQNDVIFYNLFLKPSDNSSNEEDTVEVRGDREAQAKVNEVAAAAGRGKWGELHLNVIEFGGGIKQTLRCLRHIEFSFRGLVTKQAFAVALDRRPTFGVFLAGDFKRDSSGTGTGQEQSALFVRLPYPALKGISHPGTQGESLGLTDFISQRVPGIGEIPESVNERLLVHQALFIAFNNAIVMASRSKEDEGERMVFPHQDREGAFHVLVHMIAETLRGGDRSILDKLEYRANFCEMRSFQVDDDLARKSAGEILGLVCAVRVLVAEQTKILEDLKDIFERAVPDFRKRSTHSNKYTKNMVQIPVLSGTIDRTRGQVAYVLATLEAIIKERRQFRSRCEGIFDTINKTRTTVATSVHTRELKTELLDQKCYTQALNDEIAAQGKTLSAFTVVNVLFLPLGFFSQYFSSSDSRDGVIGNSLARFWLVTAPCTFLIAAVAAYYVFRSQYEIRKFYRLFMDMITFRRCNWPMPRSDADFQKNYLRKLRKYRVQAVPADGTTEHPAAGYYLEMPEIPFNTKEENLPLKFEYTAYPCGEFRFDERNGWLFLDEVDEYDYMYYVHVDSLFPPDTVGRSTLPLRWKRSRLVMEKEPYTFMGNFRPKREGSEVYLGWRFCGEDNKRFSKPRWDTRIISRASKFVLDSETGTLKVEAEIDQQEDNKSPRFENPEAPSDEDSDTTAPAPSVATGENTTSGPGVTTEDDAILGSGDTAPENLTVRNRPSGIDTSAGNRNSVMSSMGSSPTLEPHTPYSNTNMVLGVEAEKNATPEPCNTATAGNRVSDTGTGSGTGSSGTGSSGTGSSGATAGEIVRHFKLKLVPVAVVETL